MQLIPTPDALQLWDSLTHHSTNERYCLAAQRIALAWHGAWMDAGSPTCAWHPKEPSLTLKR